MLKIWKFTFIVLALLLFSCNNEKLDIGELETALTNKANRFHQLYITAGDCSERNAMIDSEIIFFENGQQFTYEDILEYCTYIEAKEAFDIYSEQYVIQPFVGFDFVEQYYVNSAKDTIRETTSRIWQLKSDNWLVTHMQVSRNAK